MEVCRANNATPVILLALLMNRGLTKLYPDYDKPIHANIAADMREALDVPNTFKNCVCTMLLPYDREFASLSLKEQAAEYRRLLSLQRDRDYCRRAAVQMMQPLCKRLLRRMQSIRPQLHRQRYDPLSYTNRFADQKTIMEGLPGFPGFCPFSKTPADHMLI